MSSSFAPIDEAALTREASAAGHRALDEAQLALYLVLEGHAGPLTDNQQELLEAVRDALEVVAVEWPRIAGELAPAHGAGGRRDPVRLSDLLRDARTQLDAMAVRREVTLDLDLAPRRETVRVDRPRLQQALDLILRHVVQHAPRGGQVSVALAGDANGIDLDVAHDIPVIADADVILSRRIIEGMGGTIDAVPGGTTIRFPGCLGMNSIAGLIPSAAIALDLQVGDKARLLAAMVDLLALRRPVADTVLKLVERREHEGPTCIGHGFAVPHCRMAATPRVMMAYARCAEPVEYGAPDGERVRHVFLIVAPSVDLTHEYLHTLAGLARRARTAEFRAQLDDAKSVEEVVGIIGR